MKIFFLICMVTFANMLKSEGYLYTNYIKDLNYNSHVIAKNNFDKFSKFSNSNQKNFNAKEKNWWNKWGRKTSGVIGFAGLMGLFGTAAGHKIENINPYVGTSIGIISGTLISFVWLF